MALSLVAAGLVSSHPRCELHVQNQLQNRSSLPRYSSPLLKPLLAEDFSAAAQPRFAPHETWSRLAQQTASGYAVRIVVLGTSTTAGCGALSPSRLCDTGLSWARRMHDALCRAQTSHSSDVQHAERLHVSTKEYESEAKDGASPEEVAASVSPNLALEAVAASARAKRRSAGETTFEPLRKPAGALVTPMQLRTRIFAKNAVTISFYAHCTELYVPEDTDVLILEAFQSWFEGIEAVVDGVSALRRRAPNALLLFVYWPDPHDRIVNSRTSLAVVRDLAAKTRADVLDAPSLIARASALSNKNGMISSHSSRLHDINSHWFACHAQSAGGCRPDHHPSAAGHQLLAELVSHHISRGLADTRGKGSPTLLAPSTAQPEEMTEERCFTTGGSLPVVHPAEGWALRDEGGGKGVVKQGYVSKQPGAVLELGPIPSLPSVLRSWQACSHMSAAMVRLGYHAQSSYDQGSFRITCQGGCQCLQVRGYMAATSAPFPVVHTRLDSSVYGNMSVTMSTEFMAELGGAGGECRLKVQHLSNGVTHTRVRIDWLSLRRANAADLKNANFSHDERYARFVRLGLGLPQKTDCTYRHSMAVSSNS